MKAFAILRVSKLKAAGQIGSASGHNTRKRTQPHADNQTPLMGGGSRLLGGSEDAVAAYSKRISETGTKPRKGAVLALEFVASASKEWFQSASRDDREAWLTDTMAFLARTVGGEANILSAHLHDDESTPHIHLLAVPLVHKARNKSGRKPKKASAQDAQNESLSWALAAADIVGDRKKLEALQSDYALAVAERGLRRGRPRALTQAKHKSPAQYRAELAQHTEQKKKSVDRDARVTLGALERGLTLGFDAVDTNQIAYQPADANNAESLVRGSHTASGSNWKKILYAIQPVANAILLYAKARTLLMEREAKIRQREDDVVEDAKHLAEMAGRLNLFEMVRKSTMGREANHIKTKATRIRDRQR